MTIQKIKDFVHDKIDPLANTVMYIENYGNDSDGNIGEQVEGWFGVKKRNNKPFADIEGLDLEIKHKVMGSSTKLTEFSKEPTFVNGYKNSDEVRVKFGKEILDENGNIKYSMNFTLPYGKEKPFRKLYTNIFNSKGKECFGIFTSLNDAHNSTAHLIFDVSSKPTNLQDDILLGYYKTTDLKKLVINKLTNKVVVLIEKTDKDKFMAIGFELYYNVCSEIFIKHIQESKIVFEFRHSPDHNHGASFRYENKHRDELINLYNTHYIYNYITTTNIFIQ